MEKHLIAASFYGGVDRPFKLFISYNCFTKLLMTQLGGWSSQRLQH